jgi:putative peptide maturation dehydrogenase
MRVRRCSTLLIEPREVRGVDLAGVLAGGTGWSSAIQWIALTAHRDDEIILDDAMLRVLGKVSPRRWSARHELERQSSVEVIDRLLAHELLVPDGSVADEALRESHWVGLSAIAHRHLRWRHVDSSAIDRSMPLLEQLGEPPPPTRERVEAAKRLPLPAPAVQPHALESLVEQRTTCRNFDPLRHLDAGLLSTVLFRVYGARKVAVISDIAVLKKAAPSAGGLHPVEAYVLIRRVDGFQPGLYHYHPIDNALEPITELADADAADLALRFVACQHWFADAPVQVILAARFRRNFWKYRGHAKAYRAVVLDAGHLSQMQYLAATELGLAAFITAAVNEGDIEDAFGLDPMEEGILAVTGFGYRAGTMDHLEFDPLHAVWPAS